MAFAIDGVRTEHKLPELPKEPKVEATSPKDRPDGEPSPFARVMSGLGSAVQKGEHTMEKVRNAGRADLGAGELLALQTEVYRYSEAVDLSAKLVDRATNGVKTVIQGQ